MERNLTVTEIRNTVEKYERNIDGLEKVVISGELYEVEDHYEFDINVSIINEEGNYEYDEHILTDSRKTKKAAIRNINKLAKNFVEDIENYTGLIVEAVKFEEDNNNETVETKTVAELLEVEKQIEADIKFAIEFGLNYKELSQQLADLEEDILAAVLREAGN